MQATLDAMRRVLARQQGIDHLELSPSQEIASLGADSLTFIEYAFELEGELGIALPDIPRDLVTVGDFAKYVHAQVIQKAS
jgi:acyl carrier protein